MTAGAPAIREIVPLVAFEGSVPVGVIGRIPDVLACAVYSHRTLRGKIMAGAGTTDPTGWLA